jgi:CubicO group peptidase (beta-lactamase class C family)
MMRSITRNILFSALAVLILIVGLVVWYLMARIAPIGAGYKAKMLCSYLFVSNRNIEPVLANDLEPFNPLLKYVSHDVNYEKKWVKANAFGLVARQAAYREGCGCIIVPPDSTISALPELSKSDLPAELIAETLPWPTGDRISDTRMPKELNSDAMKRALDKEFSDTDPVKPRRTRAVIVVYRGQLVAERYAEGFSRKTRMHGWSMTKSITSALVGILVGQGKISVDSPAQIDEWQDPGDERAHITISHLLRMSGGFDFHHDMDPAGQRQQALFGGIDSCAYSINCPLEVKPGTRWEYANANPHVLLKVIRNVVGKTDRDNLLFRRRVLFDKIGMRSAIIEPDPFGNLIGTSFGWATARDWARFGLLYLNDGIWEGERVLPEGWVDYTRTPAPTSTYKHYGALFWLNAGAQDFKNSPETKTSRNVPPFPRLPSDAYFAFGHDGKRIAIIPSRKLVVVRLGLSRSDETWDYEGFLVDVLSSFDSL